MGHTTKQAVEFQNKVFPRWQGTGSPTLSHRKVILLGTGGYSKTYVEGAMQGQIPRGGYAEQKMLNAAILGSPVLHAIPRRIHDHSAPKDRHHFQLDLTAEG